MFHLIVTDPHGSSDREHQQKQERRFRQETVLEGAVGTRHNIIKSSFHLLSDQPLKLEAWGPDLQPGGNNVNTSQCSSQVSAKYTDIRPIVNHANLKLKIWVKPINIQFLPSQTSPLKALKPPSVLIHVYLCVTRESAAECDSEAASARLACTNRVHLSNSSSPFLADQRELPAGCAHASSSKWARCPEAELLQERGWGCVLAVGAMKPKLSTCGGVWCPAVPCTQLRLARSAVGPSWFCGNLTRTLPVREGSCSRVCSYTCFSPRMAKVQTQTPTA